MLSTAKLTNVLTDREFVISGVCVILNYSVFSKHSIKLIDTTSKWYPENLLQLSYIDN